MSVTIEKPFWKTKALQDMTKEEWESLCSRCGMCCFQRMYNRKTGIPQYTKIRCNHLNAATLQCDVYENRFDVDYSCEKVTPENIRELGWLPETCGYRTIAEGRDLEWWHPLVSGKWDTVHKAGKSFINIETISEKDMITGDLMKYLIINLSNYFFTKRK